MCVKIFTAKSELDFNVDRPLEEQIVGCKQIVIDFKPQDPQVEKFLDEVERMIKAGINRNLNITLLHNDNIFGAKAKKQVKQCEKDMNLNEIVKLMALTYDKTDRALEELFNMCKLSNNVK